MIYICDSILRSCTSQVSISGLVVKFLLAMQEPRVRFPADAILCLEAEEKDRERQRKLLVLHSLSERYLILSFMTRDLVGFELWDATITSDSALS